MASAPSTSGTSTSGGAASAAAAVTVDVRPGRAYAVVRMAKEPVNSMDLDMWSQLAAALAALEADPSVQCVVFASGLVKDIFTAGNDLAELYAPATSEGRYRKFWEAQNAFLVALYRSRLATVAAIRGACPAGGCAISLCCDHRMMTAKGSIGLNEVLLGIPVPKFWGLLMARVIGSGPADKLLLDGRLVSPQEAAAVGLVDRLVDDGGGLLPAAEALAQQLVKLPPQARAASKLNMRAEFCDAWERYYPTEVAGAWRFLSDPGTVKILGGAMRRLSSKPPPAAGAGSASSKL